jgi:integrase
MAKQIKITRKDKTFQAEQIFELLDEYIQDSYNGRRLKGNGTRITSGTVQNYTYLRKCLHEFNDSNTFELKIYIVSNLTQKERERASTYYKKFYASFTQFMYLKKKYYDNYVGLIIKCLRSFFNYLEKERNVSVGSYHKSFFVPVEEIPIVALTSQQLNYIIYNTDFNEKVKFHDLEKIRDIFVFGCTVALRVSDLLSLSKKNLIIQQEKYYLHVKSKKTNTHTSIKLPDYAIEILKRYKHQKTLLLPSISIAWFNTQLKHLSKLIPNDFELIKTRERNGKQIIVYKNALKKEHFQLSDHISTHTMRRTAITTMLCLGLPEHLVRQISGHAANSKEFFRYVKLSQSYIDNETDLFFEKMKDVI